MKKKSGFLVFVLTITLVFTVFSTSAWALSINKSYSGPQQMLVRTFPKGGWGNSKIGISVQGWDNIGGKVTVKVEEFWLKNLKMVYGSPKYYTLSTSLIPCGWKNHNIYLNPNYKCYRITITPVAGKMISAPAFKITELYKTAQ